MPDSEARSTASPILEETGCTWRFVRSTPDAEVFAPPSSEAAAVARRLRGLFCPDGEQDPWRPVREVLVAPSAVLTLGNFHHQMYLFDIFHTTTACQLSHAMGMVGVNLFLTGLSIELTGSPLGGLVFLGLLSTWYAVLARSVGLWGWWVAMGPVQAVLFAGGVVVSASLGPLGLTLGLVLAGWGVAAGHLLEPHLPPRAGDPMEWTTYPGFLLGPKGERHSPGEVVRRVVRLLPGPVIGTANEVVNAPRLLAYAVLRAMMQHGYAPELRATLDAWRDRAWASGNPAIDYIGVGGGSLLAPNDG